VAAPRCDGRARTPHQGISSRGPRPIRGSSRIIVRASAKSGATENTNPTRRGRRAVHGAVLKAQTFWEFIFPFPALWGSNGL
jgi:hypothetical protein